MKLVETRSPPVDHVWRSPLDEFAARVQFSVREHLIQAVETRVINIKPGGATYEDFLLMSYADQMAMLGIEP